jgi:hypothetical protein
MVIALQTHFVPSADRDVLLEMLRVLASKQEITSEDVGIGQTVRIMKGVTLSGERRVPNPVTLRPRRSFAEVDPPDELFVVRVQEGRSGAPEIGLFGVGEAWLPTWISAVGEEVNKRLKAAGLGDLPVIA